jgi:hypothetical protein
MAELGYNYFMGFAPQQRNNIIASTGIGIAVFAVLGALVIKPALALVDASSSPPSSDSSSTVSTTSSEPMATDDASSTGNTAIPGDVATSTPEAAPAPAAPTPPADLKEVHITGTKYVDYFTDGTTVTSYPGDPQIDDHLAEPNAPIPTQKGLTWVHTSGFPLYDTLSGDLEAGDYALQMNGEYIENALPFVSSTSTPVQVGSQMATSTGSSTPSDDGSTGQSEMSTTSADGASTSTNESAQAAVTE